MGTQAQDGTGVVKVDSWLEPYSQWLRQRYSSFQKWVNTINHHEGGLAKFSEGYEKMGFNVLPNNDITYREWAPNATTAHLIGDFNNWDRQAHPMKKNPFGVFEITLPAVHGHPAIPHNSKVKITMTTPRGEHIDRLPAWITRVTQDIAVSPVYDAIFWNPPEKYVFKNKPPQRPLSVRVYEAHGTQSLFMVLLDVLTLFDSGHFDN